MIGVTILGATGTIGLNTLDVIARHPQRYRVVALTGNSNSDRLYELCCIHQPEYAVLVDAVAAEKLADKLRSVSDTKVLAGTASLEYVASLTQTHYVMAAIVGAAGLMPALAAVKAGKRIMLANKEALVMAGKIFMDAVRHHRAELLPVDSEHNAIFQCMPRHFAQGLAEVGVRRILLTASGGPFRQTPLAALKQVKPEQACAHPNWVMGRKISVDSATMMNKGLEVIEACWLFNTTPEAIQVVLHPQSIIHSMVEYLDGSILAQLGSPDMRTPIAYALAWPDRIESGVRPLNLFEVAKLEFEQLDLKRFPCLRLAYEAMQAGGTATAILNAANEVAVAAFLEGRLPFTEIASTVEQALTQISSQEADSLEVILEADQMARNYVHSQLQTPGQVAP